MSENLLEVQNLKMHFPVKEGVFQRATKSVKAVDGVSLSIKPGETLGLVGESGCGKSTLGKAIVRLLDLTSGSVRFDGRELAGLSQVGMRPIRRNIQMMFQDPAESLDSRLSVRQIISEPLDIHGIGAKEERRKRVDEMLDKVSMPKAAADKFPFEFSGGQRQRIGIARALALEPKLLVLDEPVSALDVSVQSQVMNLLLELQEEMGLSYLFIAHDLAVVKHISDRVAVMYLGKIVEMAGADEIYQEPLHAYTKALLSAIPVPDPTVEKERILLEGDVPSPIDPPKGSAFGHRIDHPRYEETIGKEMPLIEAKPGHWVMDDPCCFEGAQ